MGDSYSSCFIHYVFSTKERRPLIIPELRDQLWSYMGGIARLNKMIPVIIGGDVDHSHTVIKLPTTLTIAKGIQVIKAGSSKWVHETYPAMANFAWQVGYGAFSISSMNLPSAIAYVRQQEEHHKKISFKDEYLGILKKHGVAIDERYIWD